MSTPDNNNPNPVPLETVGAPAASAPAPAPIPAPAAQGPKPSLQERKLFNFYRPEEGHRGRALIGGIAISVLALYGCHALWDWLPKGVEDFWGKHLFDLGDEQFTINPAVTLALGLSIASLLSVFKLVNYPRFVDFLIDTENELKKVSWASKRQVISESIVVLATVILIGFYVFLVDMLLQLVKRFDWEILWHKLGLG
jgi:preprotein translocase subunit SecE